MTSTLTTPILLVTFLSIAAVVLGGGFELCPDDYSLQDEQKCCTEGGNGMCEGSFGRRCQSLNGTCDWCEQWVCGQDGCSWTPPSAYTDTNGNTIPDACEGCPATINGFAVTAVIAGDANGNNGKCCTDGRNGGCVAFGRECAASHDWSCEWCEVWSCGGSGCAWTYQGDDDNDNDIPNTCEV